MKTTYQISDFCLTSFVPTSSYGRFKATIEDEDGNQLTAIFDATYYDEFNNNERTIEETIEYVLIKNDMA